MPLSSRNMKLTPENRAAAVVIPQALAAGAAAIEAGERDPAAVRDVIAGLIEPVAPVVYVHVLSEMLQDVSPLAGPLRLLACADFGGVEILDNIGVTV